MKKKVSSRISRMKKLFSCSVNISENTPSYSASVDVREEYANAFRTQSYLDFWTRVVELSDASFTVTLPTESTLATRLSSYRLFSEYLLDPDQHTVTQILTMARKIRPKVRTMLSDYFALTSKASLLCSLLLKDVEKTRVKYSSFKRTLKSLETTQFLPPMFYFPKISTQINELSSSINPLVSSDSCSSPIRVQLNCVELLQRLESKRDKARAKLHLINKLKHGSALVLVAITVSLSVIIVTHALSFLVAAPALISASIKLASSKRLARTTAQLDAAAKGTYTLSRDLDTISHLVSRLNDELEHIRGMAKFWVELRDQDLVQTGSEVARQLKKNECCFNEQVDELEEHLYLCFMTINRARNIVVKEILNQPANNKHRCALSSK